ncbi:MAG: TnsA endonuclease N-terminal domain-containing protein [Minisyncoccia bacterium]
MYTSVYKGRYKVSNPTKYRGDTGDVIYRSSWELQFMKWCDNNEYVLEWGSEVAIIPYKSPVDNKIHRYFVDFYVKIKDKTGNIQKYLIEIKPEKFTKPPEIPKRKTRKFIEEVFQYGTNQAKWKAAESYCSSNNLKFLVLTEKDLGVPQ